MIVTKKVFMAVLAISSLAFITPVIAAGYYYQLQISPSTLVLVNTPVTATATTDDSSIVKVVFKWVNPSGVIERTFEDSSPPFRDEHSLDEVDDWEVIAVFSNGVSKRASITVVITAVIPELPLGSIVAVAMPLLAAISVSKMRRLKTIR